MIYSLEIGGSKDDLIVYLPGGYYQAYTGQVYGPGPGSWIDSRDLELCKQLNQRTGYSIYSPAYNIGSSYSNTLKYPVPYNWIEKNVILYTLNRGFSRIHLVGFSGGASAASAQVLYYPYYNIKDMVLISSPMAVGPKVVHENAAYYSDKIHTNTLIIYGSQDTYRNGLDEWSKHNSGSWMIYPGGHDYGSELASVVNRIVEFLGTTPTPQKRKFKLMIDVQGFKVPVTLTEGEPLELKASVTGSIID